jgi:hypothetical protein
MNVKKISIFISFVAAILFNFPVFSFASVTIDTIIPSPGLNLYLNEGNEVGAVTAITWDDVGAVGADIFFYSDSGCSSDVSVYSFYFTNGIDKAIFGHDFNVPVEIQCVVVNLKDVGNAFVASYDITSLYGSETGYVWKVLSLPEAVASSTASTTDSQAQQDQQNLFNAILIFGLSTFFVVWLFRR